jgi:hypothetical protein
MRLDLFNEGFSLPRQFRNTYIYEGIVDRSFFQEAVSSFFRDNQGEGFGSLVTVESGRD